MRRGRRLRRFSRLTAADVELLEQLPPAAAKEIEKLTRRQAYGDGAYAARSAPLELAESASRPGSLGGGRKRRAHRPAD